jgi:predicted PurR-regulated permease PerM
MIKDKLNYKLVNSALIMVIIYLLYKTGGLWIGIISKLWSLLLPFIIAFIIAYALYPLVKWLTNNKVPKALAILLAMLLIIGILVIFGAIVFPLLFNQLGSLFNGIMTFINELSVDYDLSLGNLSVTLSNSFNNIINNLSKYVSDGAINVISVSISLISQIFIAFAAAVYILLDMDNIRASIKKYLKRKSKKMYNYVALLDKEMHSYLSGFVKIMIISLFEYSIAYAIIGHPNALMLGCLAMIANLIPYFGGIINNIVAAVTAFVISPALFIRTLIVFAILSMVDGYVINPLVYGKTNKVHPIVVIMSVFIGGALFGIIGIIISLPTAIILITTFKYFKDDVKDKIEDIKEKNIEN